MLKIKIDKDTTFEFKEEKNSFFLNGELVNWDISAIDANTFHIIKDNKSYLAEIVEKDHSGKIYKIRIGNHIIETSIRDQHDILLEQMGFSVGAGSKINEIKAPMPGLILDIKISEGQEVKKGDQLLVLEAMKMENVIKSPGEGIIKHLKVKKGEAVEKGHVLIIFN